MRDIIKTETDEYQGIVDEIEAIAVETVFNARQTILEGKLQVGGLVASYAKEHDVPVTALMQSISQRTKVSERELYYCYQYFEQQPKLIQMPEYVDKNISWNKVKRLMAGKSRTEPCEHNHVVEVTLCEDCGKKLS